MIFRFFSNYHNYVFMNEIEKAIKEIKFLDFSRMTFKQFYNDLNDAISLKKTQSIWQLSKIITRYSLIV